MKWRTLHCMVAILLVIIIVVILHNIILRFAISKVIGDDIYRRFLNHQVSHYDARVELPDRFLVDDVTFAPHNYEFVLNPQSKCDDDVFLVVMVASALWEFERRDIIRATWGSREKIYGRKVRYLFFVADDGDANHVDSVKREASMYDDVIMENFDEKYRNLTLKTQGQLKWISEFCSSSPYVIHVDDDVFVNLDHVIDYLQSKGGQKRLIGCGKVFTPLVRRDGKWEMPVEEYPAENYPKSCLGWCFIMSQEVASEIYLMSLVTHHIHLEDVMFTGILRLKVGDLDAEQIPGGEEMCKHKGWPKDKPTNLKLVEEWNIQKEKINNITIS